MGFSLCQCVSLTLIGLADRKIKAVPGALNPEDVVPVFTRFITAAITSVTVTAMPSVDWLRRQTARKEGADYYAHLVSQRAN
jgi:hypothetical protein